MTKKHPLLKPALTPKERYLFRYYRRACRAVGLSLDRARHSDASPVRFVISGPITLLMPRLRLPR